MKIAYGDSRTARKWKNNEISWKDFCKRVSTTQYTTETVEEYRKMTKARRDAIKDVGGYVAGHLKDGRRKRIAFFLRKKRTPFPVHRTVSQPAGVCHRQHPVPLRKR